MSTAPFTIYLVDDDAGVLKALARLLTSHGYDARTFTSARDFLDAHDPALPGCAVLDVAMPDLDGLQLQQALAEGGAGRPVIFVTGRGDIPTSVRAMKAGAADFLTKPVKEEDLLDAISRIREREALLHHERQELQAVRSRLATLTPREHEVLTHVIAGRLNKQIAFDLGTVEKTIKVHRGRMMEKMGVRSVAELVRMAERAGIRPPET
ncbi:response regulator transcription factor [Vineibacter terrae]|uniref:Response regulator transcription factor n=1 Tax=Vineibacter terrae TaxID=2586908 RepID=A0A5C8PUM9_9HYPH|nr:response regulator [Vineibacter terrae]TXL81673.1 response regulator transcription factor [Vineibacter terrae]